MENNEVLVLDEVLGLCESPIEKTFLMALITVCKVEFNIMVSVSTGKHHFSNYLKQPYPKLYPITTSSNNLGWLDIIPQYNVGKYRPDFMLNYQHDRDGFPYIDDICIECDGHQFHEKTKEQAKRDKSRDRELQSNGYTVLHFTGSEIYNNALKHARETVQFLLKKVEEKESKA